MTNTIAIILALIIAALVGADLVLNGGDALLFLARKLMELLEWLAFWR